MINNSINSRLDFLRSPIAELIKESSFMKDEIDHQLLQAFENVDVEEIKSLLKRGANPYIKMDLDFVKSLKVFSLIQDRDLLSKHLLNSINVLGDEVEGEEFLNEVPDVYINRFSSFLKNGGHFSEKFFPNLTAVVLEVLPTILTNADLESLELDRNITLFDFAFEIRDLDLIKLLFESGYKLSTSEMKESNFFDVDEFTQKTSEIIDYMLSQGYKIDDFLGEEDSFSEIIQYAKEENNHVLIDFLAKHGIEEELLANDSIDWKTHPTAINC